MSTKSESNTHTRKSTTRRPGRTLLVKPTSNVDLSVLDTLEGCTTKHLTEKSNSYFLTFATADQSLNALKELKNQFGTDVRVKFAHYRVYFTLSGLVDTSDYGEVKNTHTLLVTEGGKCNVLYYRLYRRDNHYLGCGDMTVDTKEGFDQLMSSDSLKDFVLTPEVSGIHYRFNKTQTNPSDSTPRESTHHDTTTPRESTHRSNTRDTHRRNTSRTTSNATA